MILKARRLADDHAEQERADAAVKAWLLAQIEKKRARPDVDIARPAPDQPYPLVVRTYAASDFPENGPSRESR